MFLISYREGKGRSGSKNMLKTSSPNIKVTYNISDSILIANYAKECYYNSIENGEPLPQSEKGIGVIE